MEENKLTIFNENMNKVYCSKKATTLQERKLLFNALESCDIKLNDIVGQVISIKDIYIEERQIIDETTGEVKPKYRTIIFDDNNQSYATGSYGVYNSLCRIIALCGLPDSWSESLKVKVEKKSIGDGKQSLTLLLAD